MKRFLVFSYENYYPCGGTTDLDGAFDTEDEAMRFVEDERSYSDVVEVLDTHTGRLRTRYSSFRRGAVSWGDDEDVSEKLGIVKTA